MNPSLTEATGILTLPCRYYRVYSDEDVPCEEAHFRHVERTLSIPVQQAALVLVDVWSTHYIESFLQRAAEVTRERIVPILEAARHAGVPVIHGPSPLVADRYASAPLTENSGGSMEAPDWPPAEFRGLYRGGDWAEYGRDAEPRLHAALERYQTELDIAEAAKPLPGELVIHNDAQLHRWLAERKILHLFYVGFATNWCIMLRDYGIVAMSERGYNCILLRDATTGIEFHDTAKSLTATQIAIREIETKYAWSSATDDFVRACAQAGETT